MVVVALPPRWQQVWLGPWWQQVWLRLLVGKDTGSFPIRLQIPLCNIRAKRSEHSVQALHMGNYRIVLDIWTALLRR